MVRTITRIAAIGTLLATTLASSPTTGAWAATTCSAPQEKTFSLPGRPDVCVGAVSNEVVAGVS
ncbi:hypothetical protein WBK31_38080 [Nonomuraea sp. N2-4H]|uniref:hypothetical protein n=1 Tax=Nonomuraea sp. N2-4H TaxID=3128898 RepID=UPI0032492AF3